MGDSDLKIKVHGIQLVDIKVLELNIRVSKSLPEEELRSVKYDIESGFSEYRDNHISVGVRASGVLPDYEPDKSPLSVFVEVVGLFLVDEAAFDINMLDKWARDNAPIILYPYIRENIYSLSIRCGVHGLFFPLVSVPTLSKN